MDQALQKAALKGDTTQLEQLLQEDPLALDGILLGNLIHTPLHVSAFRGHLPFTTAIVNRCPSLVLALDSRRWAPLHLAAAEGHVEVARVLAEAGPEMCGAVDGDGYNPLHLAAVKGRAEVLTELVRVGVHAAREKTGGREGILHLCVKHGRLECLKVLVENVKDPEFTNGKDCDGNNVLHQAVKYKQIQIIKYMISPNIKIDINATNSMGLTPLDILLQPNYDMNVMDFEIIRDTLRDAGARKAKKANEIRASVDWLDRRRESLMIVASLIASMAFAAGLNPPGGVWQEYSSLPPGGKIDVNEIAYRAGEAIIAYNYSTSYKFYLRSNTIAFVSSLSIILLLISGLPFKRKRYIMWTLQVVMWVTISAMAFTYAYALVALTPKKDRASLKRTLVAAVFVWSIVMALVFLGNAIRLCMKGKGKAWWRRMHPNHNPQIQQVQLGSI